MRKWNALLRITLLSHQSDGIDIRNVNVRLPPKYQEIENVCKKLLHLINAESYGTIGACKDNSCQDASCCSEKIIKSNHMQQFNLMQTEIVFFIFVLMCEGHYQLVAFTNVTNVAFK
mmetsp:Transcript_31177/g.38064  ORF Transcript_31177/g.38064 Transcript_31177/m.38064 type:complete len:117 (-) Transcript_31177:585-935(-)